VPWAKRAPMIACPGEPRPGDLADSHVVGVELCPSRGTVCPKIHLLMTHFLLLTTSFSYVFPTDTSYTSLPSPCSPSCPHS